MTDQSQAKAEAPRVSEATLCNHCDNVHPESRHSQPWRWMCTKFPRLEGFGYVTDDRWDKFPPFMFCNDINGGACPLYTPKGTEQ